MTPLFTMVTTAAVSHDLVTLADLREQLQLKPNDTANDLWLAKVISRASRQAEGYCGRIFVVQSYVDTYSSAATGNPGEPLILSQAPVDPASVAVTLDGVALAPTTDFGLDQYAGLLYRLVDTLAWVSTTGLSVAYDAGFDPIPDDVQQAVLELCTVENSGRGRDPMLRARESPGLGRQEYWVGGIPGSPSMAPDIAGLLDNYVRGLIA